MPSIQLLDKNTINKIAAGEVVERPVSIVKELVENAIDAKASAITIEIRDGGMKLIRITDNGTGIDASDIDNAFLRHSTSKIHNINDLENLMSLGFRGEALASIASVSMVEVITKTVDALTGVRSIFEDGSKKLSEEIGCPEGTTMIIKNLFYNVPARKKFLKSASTEGSYISDLVNRLALSHPDISFKFVNNGSVKLHTTGNNNLRDCIMNVFGKDIARNVLEVKAQNDHYKIEGFIGRPSISRGNRNYETYFINRRYIKSKIIQKGIEDAYKERQTLHQYPFTVFNITIDANKVDVNVHPTKMEVRFDEEKLMYGFINTAIKEVLERTELIHQVTFSNQKQKDIKKEIKAPEPFEVNRIKAMNHRETIGDSKAAKANSGNVSYDTTPTNGFVRESIGTQQDVLKTEKMNVGQCAIQNNIIKANQGSTQSITSTDRLAETDTETNNAPTKVAEQEKIIEESQLTSAKYGNIEYNNDKSVSGTSTQMDLEAELFVDEKSVVHHKVVGQLFSTYWVVELKDKYYIIDQHAAHEKVLYERIINSLDDRVHYQQGVLYPTVIQLNPREMEVYKSYEGVFNRLGFGIEEFGEDAVVVRSVPFIFDKPINEQDFLMILDELEEEYNPNQYESLLHDIATMACKAAVKANDKMTTLEYEALLNELLTLENPFNCPHGRPTIIAMTKYELEKKFKRII